MEVNSLFQGDCLEGFSRIKPGAVDLVFADPPFNIGYDYDTYDDGKDAEEYLPWCDQWGREIHRVLRPNGSFWRNDDGLGTCGTCPLVKAITPQSGWYTLQISHFNAGGVLSNFTAKYGRYPSGNPNCNNPTTPILAPSPGAPK